MKRGGGGAGNPNSSMPRPKITKNRPKKQKSAEKRGAAADSPPPPPPPLLEMSRIYTLAPRDVTRTAVCTYLAHYYTQRTYILSACSLHSHACKHTRVHTNQTSVFCFHNGVGFCRMLCVVSGFELWRIDNWSFMMNKIITMMTLKDKNTDNPWTQRQKVYTASILVTFILV